MTIKTCPFCKLKMKKNDTCSGIWYSHVAHTGCFMCNFIVNEDDVEAWDKRASSWIKIADRLPEDRQACLYRNTTVLELHAGNYYTDPRERESGYFVHNNGTGYEPATSDMEWTEVPE